MYGGKKGAGGAGRAGCLRVRVGGPSGRGETKGTAGMGWGAAVGQCGSGGQCRGPGGGHKLRAPTPVSRGEGRSWFWARAVLGSVPVVVNQALVLRGWREGVANPLGYRNMQKNCGAQWPYGLKGKTKPRGSVNYSGNAEKREKGAFIHSSGEGETERIGGTKQCGP